MSWFNENNDWSWDYSWLDPLIGDINRPFVLKMLGYMLDNIFERIRYLTGTLDRFVGISLEKAYYKIQQKEW